MRARLTLGQGGCLMGWRALLPHLGRQSHLRACWTPSDLLFHHGHVKKRDEVIDLRQQG